jgi:hypothetical protein
MVGTDQEKLSQLRALAAQFRHAADETLWPRYRAKLLDVAQDLENEAEKLSVQASRLPRGTSRTG